MSTRATQASSKQAGSGRSQRPQLGSAGPAQGAHVAPEKASSKKGATRKRGAPPAALRPRRTKLKRPFIEADLGMLFGTVIMVKPARGKLPRRDIDLAKHRNLALPGLVDIAGTRLLRDKQNIPYRLHPWRLMSRNDSSTPITVDPEIMSGRAVVTGTRIPISLLAGMKNSGKTIEQIAKSYRLHVDVTEKVLRHIERSIQKVA